MPAKAEPDRSRVGTSAAVESSPSLTKHVEIQALIADSAETLAGATHLRNGGYFDRLAAVEACARNHLLDSRLWIDLLFGAYMQVDLREEVSRQIYLHRGYEHELSSHFARHVKPGDVVFDIGAHYGYFSILAATLAGETGRVVAFEPLPETFAQLATNTGNLPQVIRVQAAAWSVTREMEFLYHGRAWSAFSSFDRPRLDGVDLPEPQKIIVPCVKLDEFCVKHDIWPNYIKIDAENAEAHVIEGLSRVIETCAPIISVEVGDFGGRSAEGQSSREMLELLTKHGYELFEPTLEADMPHTLLGIGKYEFGNIVAHKSKPKPSRRRR